MEKLIMDNQNYEYYEYEKEVEFEKMIVDNSCKVFGESSIYFDVI